MKYFTFLRALLLSCGLTLVACRVAASTEQAIYPGPVLEITVQRGEDRLPLALVNHLHKGDRLWVQPQMTSLAKGDWIVLLATISPSGHRVDTARFDLSKAKVQPMIEVQEDNLVPVVLLAPQVRNLFGLYTSFNESVDLLKAAVEGDPQLFVQLQKLDQVNQTVSALREDLDQLLQNKTPEEAITTTQNLAAKFGVKTIDAE